MRTPCPALTNEQSRRSSDSANRLLIETLSAFARAPIVDSDGEIDPFSIFDSMPAEMPAAVPSSATVRSRPLRSRRTSVPISSSTLLARKSAGASEPVSKSSAPRLALRAGFAGFESRLPFFATRLTIPAPSGSRASSSPHPYRACTERLVHTTHTGREISGARKCATTYRPGQVVQSAIQCRLPLPIGKMARETIPFLVFQFQIGRHQLAQSALQHVGRLQRAKRIQQIQGKLLLDVDRMAF